MKFAILYSWPNDKCSEFELIRRIAIIAEDLGHECIVTDPFGNLMTSQGEHHPERAEPVDWREYDFCLHLLLSPNFLDTFSYAVNWNPLDFVIRDPIGGSDLSADQIAYKVACFESHDSLLSAGSEEMDDFAAALNLVSKQHISKKIYLHTTSDKNEFSDFPDFSNFKIFYIGVNWERARRVGRHKGLLERLDETGLVMFYGIKEQQGIPLWKGIQNYKGELPFDGGKSILEKSNQCGVSLVLHSHAHRESGLVSTRIFQACAAKTLTICDHNPFIHKHFGDSVLYFQYRNDPLENCEQIMEKAEWIRNHPDKALDMAQRAYDIFAENFSLKKEIVSILQNHESNIRQYLTEFGATDHLTRVDVLYIYRQEHAGFNRFADDIEAQAGISPRAVIFVSEDTVQAARDAISKRNIKYEIVEWEGEQKGYLLPYDGRIVAHYLQNYMESSWFTLYTDCSGWKKYHLTQLVRAGEKEKPVVMSGTFVKNRKFSNLHQDYTAFSIQSIGGHPRGITEQDIGVFNAAGVSCSSILFHTPFFQKKNLIKALRFFDKGWFFFLVTWSYIQNRRLPCFVPKLTNIFIRGDEQWVVDSYMNNNTQTEDFECSLTYAFLKNDRSNFQATN